MKWERIAIAVLALALVAAIIMRFKTPTAPTADQPNSDANVSVTEQNSNVTKGPSYLMYNQGPWAFAPPVGNFLPKIGAPGGSVVMTEGNETGCFDCMM